MNPYVIDIVQGETFFVELSIKDEFGNPVNITPAAKSLEVGSPIVEADFVISAGDEVSLMEIRADGTETADWPVGKYPLQVWLDWGSLADIEHEVIFEAIISVRSKP